MPTRAKRVCPRPGCPGAWDGNECTVCGGQAKRQADRYRGNSSQRGYGARWQRARRQYLLRHPLCVECLQEGRDEAATVVDHAVPHRGDMVAFWKQENWAALCKRHHNEKTGRGE